MIVGRRSPNLSKRAFRHQPLAPHRFPERAANRAGIGPPIEHRANNFHFARAGITMLSQVGVESQRAIVAPFDQPLLLQKMNRQNRCVATIATPKRQCPISQISQRSNRPSSSPPRSWSSNRDQCRA